MAGLISDQQNRVITKLSAPTIVSLVANIFNMSRWLCMHSLPVHIFFNKFSCGALLFKEPMIMHILLKNVLKFALWPILQGLAWDTYSDPFLPFTGNAISEVGLTSLLKAIQYQTVLTSDNRSGGTGLMRLLINVSHSSFSVLFFLSCQGFWFLLLSPFYFSKF